jgi:pyruvate kinase
MSRKLTKIVATLGPASDSPETIEKLISSGVNVFRFNTKHGTPEWHEERIKLVQEVADRLGTSIGILLDLQGPEIRIETRDGEDVPVFANETVNMSFEFRDGVNLVIPEKNILHNLEIGDRFYIDDGKVALEVVSKENEEIGLKSEKDAAIKHRKGVNMPDKTLDLPSLVEADLKQLDMASLNKVDFIALSFVRDTKDVDALRKEIKDRNINAKVVLKIENRAALKNLDSLIEAGDAVMVARGDMGIEVAIEEIAFWQKMIIDKCRNAHKPVITATEMLDSMMRQERPTRAEATDVSNAVFDGTDAVMLSGETASGDYPVESVETMAKIASFTESKLDISPVDKEAADMTQLICIASMEMVINEGIEVDKIVVFTHTGYTARVISSFRPNVPILAVTDSQKTVETLELSYAVSGHKFGFADDEIISPTRIVEELMGRNQIAKNESVLVIHGARWKTPGLTNSITLVSA